MKQEIARAFREIRLANWWWCLAKRAVILDREADVSIMHEVQRQKLKALGSVSTADETPDDSHISSSNGSSRNDSSKDDGTCCSSDNSDNGGTSSSSLKSGGSCSSIADDGLVIREVPVAVPVLPARPPTVPVLPARRPLAVKVHSPPPPAR
jgi:hypothetical protein